MAKKHCFRGFFRIIFNVHVAPAKSDMATPGVITSATKFENRKKQTK